MAVVDGRSSPLLTRKFRSPSKGCATEDSFLAAPNLGLRAVPIQDNFTKGNETLRTAGRIDTFRAIANAGVRAQSLRK